MKLWQYLIGNFILTVTRITSEKDLRKKLTVKRKSVNFPSNLAIYKFNIFDDFLSFCTTSLNSEICTYDLLRKSTLYLYKSEYYLSVYVNEKNLNKFKSMHCLIIEFSSLVNNSELFETKLKEYGKIIFKTNAINNCIKHFN